MASRHFFLDPSQNSLSSQKQMGKELCLYLCIGCVFQCFLISYKINFRFLDHALSKWFISFLLVTNSKVFQKHKTQVYNVNVLVLEKMTNCPY